MMDESKTTSTVIPEEWVLEQLKIHAQVSTVDINTITDTNSIKFIAGFDISTPIHDNNTAVGCLTILSYPSLDIVYQETRTVTLDLPYIPSFLAFREAPLALSMLETAISNNHRIDLLFIDGNGLLHPRKCGLACYIGVKSGIPTIGVAKTYFEIHDNNSNSSNERLTSKKLKEIARERLTKPQDHFFIYQDMNGNATVNQFNNNSSNTILGAVVKPCENVRNPIFVSVGHNISIHAAILWLYKVSRHRVPEPIRLSDLRSREVVRETEVEKE